MDVSHFIAKQLMDEAVNDAAELTQCFIILTLLNYFPIKPYLQRVKFKTDTHTVIFFFFFYIL